MGDQAAGFFIPSTVSPSDYNGNLANQKFISKAVLEDPSVYPDSATMQRLFTITARDQKTLRLTNRLWTKVKTGK